LYSTKKPYALGNKPLFPRAQRRQALRSSWLSWSVWLKATVLKKAVQRFLLICLFWFVLDIDLEKWGAGSECDRTTTPLIRAECQHLVLKCLCPYSLKGYSHFYMTAVLTAVLTAVFYLSALFA